MWCASPIVPPWFIKVRSDKELLSQSQKNSNHGTKAVALVPKIYSNEVKGTILVLYTETLGSQWIVGTTLYALYAYVHFTLAMTEPVLYIPFGYIFLPGVNVSSLIRKTSFEKLFVVEMI